MLKHHFRPQLSGAAVAAEPVLRATVYGVAGFCGADEEKMFAVLLDLVAKCPEGYLEPYQDYFLGRTPHALRARLAKKYRKRLVLTAERQAALLAEQPAPRAYGPWLLLGLLLAGCLTLAFVLGQLLFRH